MQLELHRITMLQSQHEWGSVATVLHSGACGSDAQALLARA